MFSIQIVICIVRYELDLSIAEVKNYKTRLKGLKTRVYLI
jgi:hypothetical protein